MCLIENNCLNCFIEERIQDFEEFILFNLFLIFYKKNKWTGWKTKKETISPAVSDSAHRPAAVTAAAGNCRRKSPLEIAAGNRRRKLAPENCRRKSAPEIDLSSKRWQPITTVSFVSAFIIVSTGRPKNACKWV